ncbi:MAG: CBS domain-containing protein [Anaerolineaceae bacterium]|nr:CBS domain-containing protein [Anaerolineaceae bacterium]MBN2677457.1 CBS domain-containing protein [Anaerolineaceae bacterium]
MVDIIYCLPIGKEILMKKCNEVMTKKPVCCLPNDTVTKAAQSMKNENVGSIPVINDEKKKKLIGIVTDRDLALQIVADGRDPKTTKVADVMTSKVYTCFADDDIQKAVAMMAKHQLRRIPVVDNDQKIIGVISQADVATRVNKRKKKLASMIKKISQPSKIPQVSKSKN